MNAITLPRSVLEQALEALESGIQYDYHGNPYSDNDAARCVASDALRAALEQPQDHTEQEPVGEAGSMPGTDGFTMACFRAIDVPVGTKLYIRPQPPRQPLTREEIAFIAAACGGLASDFVVSVARAIEAAHGVKGRK